MIMRRVGASIGMLALTSALVFVTLRLLPGDPTVTFFGSTPGVSDEQRAELRVLLGLDEPIWNQYLTWIAGVLRGDFGVSYFSQYPVGALLAERIGPSLQLAAAALILALLISIPLAYASAAYPRSPIARLANPTVSIGMAAPPFWVGIMLIAVFSVNLGLLPARGYAPLGDFEQWLRYAALPATTMAIGIVAPVLLFQQNSLRENLQADYIRTALGKGLTWRRAVNVHGLKNSAVPALDMLGIIVGYLMGGAVVIEYMFGWPGIGSLAVDAVYKRDYAVIQGVVLFTAAAFFVVTLAVDLAAMALDPRLRTGRSA